MGEAKRRRELGLPPKAKKERKSKTNENKFPWSQISINKLKGQYPAAPFVTTALVLIVLQLGFSLNSWLNINGVFRAVRNNWWNHSQPNWPSNSLWGFYLPRSNKKSQSQPWRKSTSSSIKTFYFDKAEIIGGVRQIWLHFDYLLRGLDTLLWLAKRINAQMKKEENNRVKETTSRNIYDPIFKNILSGLKTIRNQL